MKNSFLLFFLLPLLLLLGRVITGDHRHHLGHYRLSSFILTVYCWKFHPSQFPRVSSAFSSFSSSVDFRFRLKFFISSFVILSRSSIFVICSARQTTNTSHYGEAQHDPLPGSSGVSAPRVTDECFPGTAAAAERREL